MSEQHTIEEFLDGLASQSPTPGGGSVAALMGALGAALVSMVCNLTRGKEKYANAEIEMTAVLTLAEATRADAMQLLTADIAVFEQVMGAYGLPRESDGDKNVRRVAIQSALKAATEVPLACARCCARVIDLSERAASAGNLNVISDAGVAVMAAFAGLKSAALNVYTNVRLITDAEFARQASHEIDALVVDAETKAPRIYALVKSKL
ncbi:MAG: cyclodeaminase/cyclohydrolase family protein [Gammaproteobacteria bacterium]|nr:cyclodeaminase/cyclohydrolase family protein [Gammaproteobacteria bacterium]